MRDKSREADLGRLAAGTSAAATSASSVESLSSNPAKQSTGVVRLSKRTGVLSQRDWMMVAWHEGLETGGYDPSRRERCECGQHRSFIAQDKMTSLPTDHTVPYGTESLFLVSRHYVPGYLHGVPSGQKTLAKF
ncbi:MAG TPA: hypothetical protein VN939_19780 [Chthoniobacterales bacterium]|nr:hypothetical protein [Chthoniobacterales bacterium]